MITLLKVVGRIVNDNPHGDRFGVPTDWRGITVPIYRKDDSSYVYNLSITNDAHEAVVSSTEGTLMADGQWKYNSHTWVMLRREVMFRFAVWYLWQRAWGEWFGLRRKLFYWWLAQDIQRWQIEHPTKAPAGK